MLLLRPVNALLLVTLRVAPLPTRSVVMPAALLAEALKLPTVTFTPSASTRAPLGLLLSPATPLLGVPRIRRFDALPRFPPAPTASVPLLICTAPLKELLAERFKVPPP